MPIALVCPKCGARVKAPGTAVGKTLACPRCKAGLPVRQPVDDEEEGFQTAYHWAILLRPTFYLVLVSVLLIGWYLGEGRLEAMAASEQAWATSRIIVQIALWVGLAYSVVLMAWRVGTFVTSEFAVSAQHILVKDRLLRRAPLELPLRKVEDVTVEQGMLGSRLGYGTVVIVSKGAQQQRCVGIAAAREFRKAIRARMEAST